MAKRRLRESDSIAEVEQSVVQKEQKTSHGQSGIRHSRTNSQMSEFMADGSLMFVKSGLHSRNISGASCLMSIADSQNEFKAEP